MQDSLRAELCVLELGNNTIQRKLDTSYIEFIIVLLVFWI